MKIGYKTTITFLIWTSLSMIMPAQEIPVLPAEGNISVGVLPNGMTYYVVLNESAGEMSDFALVRKDGKVVRYDNVMAVSSESKMDSTLLSIMRAAYDHSPADQAVIVAGNVSPQAVAEKIKMLSYMNPVRDTAAREPYAWRPVEGLRVVTRNCDDRQVAAMTLTWTSPRTSRENMVTIQPAISSMFLNQLGTVACERIKEGLKMAGIPGSDVGFRYVGSGDSSGDEKFSIIVSTLPEYQEKALAVMSGVMSSIDSGAATAQEVRRAHAEYLRGKYGSISNPCKDNSAYVSRCISAFLYNSSLASQRAVYDFHSSRTLDDVKGLSLFNGIAEALLDRDDNVTLELVAPSAPDSTRMAQIFRSAWDHGLNLTEKDRPEASSFLREALPDKKVKVNVRKDPMSGGSILRLESGVTVVCRNMPSDRRIHYSLVLNGGYADISGLKAGEGAYAEAYLASCSVAGVSGKDFRDALAAEGITMVISVEMFSTVISGSASKYDLAKVLQALSAFAGSRRQDPEAFESYAGDIALKVEAMKGTYMARMAAVGQLMCPGYAFSDIPSGQVADDFADRAEHFFSSQFSRMNDGVLVIAGEVSESELKKELTAYGTALKTSGRTYVRTPLSYQPVSGVSAGTAKGAVGTIDVAMSARVPLTIGNYAAYRIAAVIVEQKVAKAFEGSGWSVTVNTDFTIHPDERFNMTVSLTDDACGVKTPADRVEALSLLYGTMEAVASAGVDEKFLNAGRNHVKSRISLMQTDPAYWTEAIGSRFIYGKDLFTGYEAGCDAVTMSDVMEAVSSLNAGGKVEYTVIAE